MQVTFQPFTTTGRARVTQLINKSNQFNLTTRRYTESEVQALIDDPSSFTLQVRLRDSLGDNGIISVVICRPIAQDWCIDTWLMSCRVLGRKVETAVLQELVRNGRRLNVKRLLGTYRPTERNRMVADHYAKLGFAPDGVAQDGSTSWVLEVASAR